ncbi:uncharacterized protein LOC134694812 [Mytilus trossulus]|uniref:uncharacterized protein LOC134694812 n=1 Tax=Mytilus trossulus TaxID=6551 RepID=UPI0030042A17
MMKTTNIRYSWQLLTVLLFKTGFVHLITIRNDPTMKGNSAMLHGENRQDTFQNYTRGIKNTTYKRIGNLNQEFRHRSPINSNAPHLTMNITPNKVYEGQSVILCCTFNSRPITIDLWWDQKSSVLFSKQDTTVLCYKLVNASRYNSGGYRCYAEDGFGFVNTDVQLKVLYPPDISDQQVNFNDTDVSRTLSCLANGVPANYTYGEWKHLSFFGEHIRSINFADNGRVTLPQISKRINRYQDSGIYICNASNGVVDSTGKHFQDGKIFVIANGPPVFVDKIENKQYCGIGKIFNMQFIVYTKSEIEWCNVQSENKDIAASMEKTSVNGTTIFYGTEITVEATQVVLSFEISNNYNSQIYTVTLCNGYGNSSFEVEIEPVTTEEKVNNGTKIASITILVILVMCVSVLVAVVFLKKKRKRDRERRIVDDIPELVEGQPVPVENIVYQDAIVFRPRPLQASGEVIEYNYETYSHQENMRPLTGQLNHSDVYFQPSTSHDVQIRGIENRTVYSEVLNSERGSSVIETRSMSSSDEEDFVDIEGLENFIDRSED